MPINAIEKVLNDINRPNLIKKLKKSTISKGGTDAGRDPNLVAQLKEVLARRRKNIGGSSENNLENSLNSNSGKSIPLTAVCHFSELSDMMDLDPDDSLDQFFSK